MNSNHRNLASSLQRDWQRKLSPAFKQNPSQLSVITTGPQYAAAHKDVCAQRASRGNRRAFNQRYKLRMSGQPGDNGG